MIDEGNKVAKYNFLKAASWYAIGNILIRGISFFLLPIFTGLMSTRDYGIYSVYTSYLTLFETLVLLGLSSTVRIAKYSNNFDFEDYIATIIKIPFIVTSFFAVLINIFFIWHKQFLSMDIILWNCLFITAAFAAVINIISARFVIEGRFGIYLIYSGGYTVINIGISLFLCYTLFCSKTYMARIIGGLIPNILFGISFGCIFVKKIRLKFEILKSAIKLSIPLLLHTGATVLLVQSDRILIKALDNYENVGIYSIAVTIIAIPMVLQVSLENAWAPWFYEKFKNKEYVKIREFNNYYIILFAIIIAGFMVVSPEIVHIFTEFSYWDSIYSLIPLSMGVFAEMLYGLVINIEYYNKKTWMIAKGTIITIIINLVLDIIFIRMFGYVGAAYGTMISKFVLFFIHWIFSRKIEKNKIFNDRYIIICISILIIINIMTIIFINDIFIRYILAVILLIIGIRIFMKNKKILFWNMKKENY